MKLILNKVKFQKLCEIARKYLFFTPNCAILYMHVGVFILGKKGEFMKKIRKFLDEVKKELKKVRWPNKKEMVKYSAATICFVIFFAVFFYLIDLAVAFIRTLV